MADGRAGARARRGAEPPQPPSRPSRPSSPHPSPNRSRSPRPSDEAADEADADDVEDEEPIEDETVAAVPRPARRRGRRRTAPPPRAQGPAKAAPAAPTVSEKAVHVDDRASAIFVIAVVGVFIAIFVYALLFGYSGLASGLLPKATPTPTVEVSESPAASESASPSASAEASPSAASASPAAARPERLAERLPGGVGRSLAESLGELTRDRWTSARIARARPGRGWSRRSSAAATSGTSASSRRWPPSRARRSCPTGERAAAYQDGPLPIGAGQTISQPYIVARMTELLHVAAGERVLDIGTGSGYQAAILAELGCQVTSIEREPDLAASAAARLATLGYADRVEVRTGDGTLGAPGRRAVGRDRRRGRGARDPRRRSASSSATGGGW